MEYVLTTDALTKEYGKTQVLKGIDLQIPSGSIFGLVGRNGAGKTTLMRVITGLQEPSSGTYTLSGVKNTDRRINGIRRRMGSLVEVPALYRNMSARNNLKIQYLNLGMTDDKGIDELLSLVGLEDAGKKAAGKFSLGMRQRLGIAVAMCGNPDILVLDEPINGLDPQGIIEMRELLMKINRERDTTILISSHILDELSRLATHYAFIENGMILEQLSSEELLSRVRKSSEIRVDDVRGMCRILDDLGLTYEIAEGDRIDIFGDVTVSRLVLAAAKENIEVISVREKDENLEGYFMNLVGSGEKKR
ncbi:MAG TPA: bacitracin ABC transporter ATP-binding protein [Clostridiales bacterium]|nr:bacitracin ABC transporter ATP-binding protein [Clostridiales bacterium]